MSRIISNRDATLLGLKGKATYEDGSTIKRIQTPELRHTTLLQSVAEVMTLVKNSFHAVGAVLSGIVDSNKETVKSLEVIAAQNADLLERVGKVEQKPNAPEEWVFTFKRNSDSTLEKVYAKQEK